MARIDQAAAAAETSLRVEVIHKGAGGAWDSWGPARPLSLERRNRSIGEFWKSSTNLVNMC